VGFKDYSDPVDPTYVLDFGIVTERGCSVDLYANGNISNEPVAGVHARGRQPDRGHAQRQY
jgi:hypothetical protein